MAEADTRRHLIEEMANRARLEKLLRDSYANYVVQTALDYAESTQRAKVKMQRKLSFQGSRYNKVIKIGLLF